MAKTMICTHCGTSGVPKTAKRGSIFITLLLLCIGIIPGLIYAVWRGTTKKQVCQVCGSDQLVPLESPMGRKLASQTT